MIRVALTDEAYDAMASTLPKGAARWLISPVGAASAASAKC